MKIEIPDELIREIVLFRIEPSPFGLKMAGRPNEKTISLVRDIILEKYKDEIVLPKITKEEIKKAVLDKIAEKAVEDYRTDD